MAKFLSPEDIDFLLRNIGGNEIPNKSRPYGSDPTDPSGDPAIWIWTTPDSKSREMDLRLMPEEIKMALVRDAETVAAAEILKKDGSSVMLVLRTIEKRRIDATNESKRR